MNVLNFNLETESKLQIICYENKIWNVTKRYNNWTKLTL